MSLEGRLPPVQVLTEKWPILTHGSTPHVEPWKEERFGGR